MLRCNRTIPGLHRWSQKLTQRFAYVVMAAVDGEPEVLQEYTRSVQRLQGCIQQRLQRMRAAASASSLHQMEDLEILLDQTGQLGRTPVCVCAVCCVHAGPVPGGWLPVCRGASRRTWFRPVGRRTLLDRPCTEFLVFGRWSSMNGGKRPCQR